MAMLSVKPGQRFSVPDWHTNSHLISADAEHQRSASHQIRQEARALRNETNNQVGLWQLRSVGERLDLETGFSRSGEQQENLSLLNRPLPC